MGSTNCNNDGKAQASLIGITGVSWSKLDSQSVDGVDYDVYRHSLAGTNTTKDVYIQQGVLVI